MAATTTAADVVAAANSDDEDGLNSTQRSCANDPDFAVICAFLQKFSGDLGLDLPNFKHLQEWLTCNDAVSDQLRDLHIKLLRKTRKTVHEKTWESALSKFCYSYSMQDAWEIERFGYKNASLKIRLRVFRELLECQFERNGKFRASILALSANSLRAQPIGRDRLGHSYWLTQDHDCNLRIYQEHLDEEIWQVVATNRVEFVQLIKRLKGNEVVLPSKDIGEIDEDTSSSNSCPVPVSKPPPPEEQEYDNDDNCDDDGNDDDDGDKNVALPGEEARVPNLRIKLNTNRIETPAKLEEVEAIDAELIKTKKVKPLLITQAKLNSGNSNNSHNIPAKKRASVDVEKSSPISDELQQKKKRPMLFDAKRMNKRSRYETLKSEEDNLQDSESDEQDSELDEEDGEDEAEDDTDVEDELEGEEEDIDSAAADKDIEDNDEEDDDQAVGEVIEEPTLIVRGQGSGRECNAGRPNDFFLSSYITGDNDYEDEEEDEVGDAIEEPIYCINGEGNGADCLVGNENESKEAEDAPKARFFFGEPGCLKLSPIKQTPKSETKKSIFDQLNEDNTSQQNNEDISVTKQNRQEKVEEQQNEKTNGERNKDDEQVEHKKVTEMNNIIMKNVEATEAQENANTTPTNCIEASRKDETTKAKELMLENIKVKDDNNRNDVNINEGPNIKKLSVTEDTKELISGVTCIVKEGVKEEKVMVQEKENAIVKEENCTISEEKSVEIEEKIEVSSNKQILKVKAESARKDEASATKTEVPKSVKTEEVLQPVNLKINEHKDVSTINTTTNGTMSTENEPAHISKIEPERVATSASIIKAEVQKYQVTPNDKSLLSIARTVQIETNTETTNANNVSDVPFVKSNRQAPSISKNQTTSVSALSIRSSTTSSILLNRKRRLTDFSAPAQNQLQQNMRHSTSESELDIHSDKQDDLNEDVNVDIDVGGKRIKMRAKSTNNEQRRKIEATKETQIDQTTSSSGEEEARSRSKILIPKCRLEKMMPAKSKPIIKQKPTLAEIIEKKLKKTPEEPVEQQIEELIHKSPTESATRKILKNMSEKSVDKITEYTIDEKLTDEKKIVAENLRESAPPTVAQISNASTVSIAATGQSVLSNTLEIKTFTPPKKSPITKPLKKNLLTQIRQEESDEEPIPRKRTNSETVAVVVTVNEQLVNVKIEECESSKRQTPERQRKRRNTEDGNIAETPKVATAEETDVVSEKLKKNEQSIIQEDEDKAAVVSKAEIKTEKKLPTEELTQKAEPIQKAEPGQEVEQVKTPAAAAPQPVVANRRSGRHGGTAVVHSEFVQPKRTRSGTKAATVTLEKKEPTKAEKEVEVNKINESTTTKSSSSEFVETKSTTNDLIIPNKMNSKTKEENVAKILTPKVEPKAESEIELELKSVTKEEIKSEPKEEEANKTSTCLEKATPSVAPRGRGSRKKREVDATNIIESNDNDTPVRQSRRIAQQKIKEEAERRKMEEIALRTMKQELKKKKKAEKQVDPTVEEPSAESSSESEVELKKKTKKKCPGKDGWSSGSEEQADTEEEEDEPPHEDTDPGSPLFKSDHEFSPESDLEDESQVVPMKRARTARKENAEDDEDDADEACQKCGKSDHPEWILLCDNCDKGYHCSCLSPVLFYIPEGDWYCPPCQQEQLISALEQQLKEFDELVERKATEKRLAEEIKRKEEEQRIEEEKRLKAVKKSKKSRKGESVENYDEDGSDYDDNDDDDSDEVNKGSDEESDDGSKTSKSTKKRAKQADKSEKSKRKRGDGRSNRKAAKRGARRRRRNDSDSGSNSQSNSESDSESKSKSSSSAYSSSDDEPIYKLRKRRQINVSYRLNEYDDLINSALKKEMDEIAGAGNLGRGKDIKTIIEADKEEKARLRKLEERVTDSGENVDKTVDKNENDLLPNTDNNKNGEEDDVTPLKVKSRPRPTFKKKSRKLTTLDISSEEDNISDEDFKTSSFEEDEDTSVSVTSDSDSSLEVYRRRGKNSKNKQRKVARRAARERRKDRRFIVDESDDSEEEERPKSKKKRKEDSDYTETETDDDDASENTENLDSADLCDDTTSESSDGAWYPTSRKKQRKTNTIARKSPKLKKQEVKKSKRVEYSDDDISETEPEDDDEDDGVPGSGKGSGKQPRSQPLKSTNQAKTKSPTAAKKKKKQSSDVDEHSGSDDSTRRTRGRRYAYLEDFDDDSSDGGIKPGVKRPDTPPEERQKFIQKQEEIKRMLAEKNAEGAKLAATPRLTPIKGTSAATAVVVTNITGMTDNKRTSTKAGDSLSTVPLSVIRQAKVLDIDYLQRKGETVNDMVDDVESEFDDADFPDDLPEDMDEDAIARMVEEEEEFSAVAVRELPAPDEVLRVPVKAKTAIKTDLPATIETIAKSTLLATQPTTSASGLQEPLRKRLPMPTMHPPLLRHQFGPQHTMPPHHHMMQRHATPPMQLLQTALSAPLGQPLNRSAYPPHPSQQPLPPHHPAMQRISMGMPPGHGLPSVHLLHGARSSPLAAGPHPPPAGTSPSSVITGVGGLAAGSPVDMKPRGRRKKITPLRDPLQKQQTAAAVTASITTAGDKPTDTNSLIKATTRTSSPLSLSVAQPPQLYKPTGASNETQPSVITRMPHLPTLSVRPPTTANIFPSAELHSRFYGQSLPPSSNTGRTPAAQSSSQSPQRHLLRPQMPHGMSPHSALRQTYGPPPPLRGSAPPVSLHSQPPTSGANAIASSVGAGRSPYLHGEHHGAPPPLGSVYSAGPPPARHSAPHLNPYRPPIYGNPNYPPRVPPTTGANMRASQSHAVDYAAAPRGYPPYGYYTPPPPLTTPPAHTQQPTHSTSVTATQQSPATSISSAPSSVIVSAPPSTASATTLLTPSIPTPTNHSVSALTRNNNSKSPTPQVTATLSTSRAAPISASAPATTAPAPIATAASGNCKTVIAEPRKKLTTLEAYSVTNITKSPINLVGDSSGSPAGLHNDAAEDSSSAHDSNVAGGVASVTGEDQASEFSGLVSYFSSQHDDYNT